MKIVRVSGYTAWLCQKPFVGWWWLNCCIPTTSLCLDSRSASIPHSSFSVSGLRINRLVLSIIGDIYSGGGGAL